MKKRIYIAGPMRGYPDFNFQAFADMALRLRKIGCTVFSPHENDIKMYGDIFHSPTGYMRDLQDVGFDLRKSFTWDANTIINEVDAIVFLNGYEKSTGAMTEMAIGRLMGRELLDENLQPIVHKPGTANPAGTSIVQDSRIRKEHPIARGLLDYFPDALWEVSHVSFVGNEQHNKGQPMHWAREKSSDHADCIARHLIQRGTTDDDGLSHTAKLAWRSLALLQIEIEGR